MRQSVKFLMLSMINEIGTANSEQQLHITCLIFQLHLTIDTIDTIPREYRAGGHLGVRFDSEPLKMHYHGRALSSNYTYNLAYTIRL